MSLQATMNMVLTMSAITFPSNQNYKIFTIKMLRERAKSELQPIYTVNGVLSFLTLDVSGCLSEALYSVQENWELNQTGLSKRKSTKTVHVQVVLWCSGYHICFTRRRSPVRSWAGSQFYLSAENHQPYI